MAQDILEAHEHRFESIVGQELVKRFLLRSLEEGRLPQSLLFTGPAGVGKRSLMYALAKELVALDRDTEAADKARGKVLRGTHPDVLTVFPGGAGSQILVGQIEEIHDRVHYAPLEAERRVVLLAPAEALNPVAANDLLKILEEPPPSLHFLLASENPHRLLDTIRSRCATLYCPPVDRPTLVEWLGEVQGCSARQAETAARLSGGRPGLALGMASRQRRERRRKIVEELEFFAKHGYPAVFHTAHALLHRSENLREAMQPLLFWFRDLMVAALDREAGRAVSEERLINRDLAEEIEQASQRYHARGLCRAVERLMLALPDADRPGIDAPLAMQVLLTDIGIALKD